MPFQPTNSNRLGNTPFRFDPFPFLPEANPNPQIDKNEDFSDSAKHCGLSYPQLLQKILTLGVSYSEWSDPGFLSSSL